MRAFRISLVIFLLLIVMMLGSMVVINRICDRMVSMIESLPPEPSSQSSQTARQLYAYWQQWRGWVHPAVNHLELNAVTDHLEALCEYADSSGEGVEYRKERRLLLTAIEEVRRLERISFSNLI